jgi:hypothetical protein
MPLMYSSETNNNNISNNNNNDGNVKIKNRCYKHITYSHIPSIPCVQPLTGSCQCILLLMYCILVTVKSQFSE